MDPAYTLAMKFITAVFIVYFSICTGSAELRSQSRSPEISSLLGGGFTVLGGGLGLGASVDIGFKVMKHSPWYMGITSGLNVLMTGGSAVYVPVMLSNRYHFTLEDSKIAPYVGLDFGVGFISAAGFGFNSGFGLIVRPGFTFHNGAMFFEPKFGSVGSSFVFAPTIGTVF